jgi:hypothetical protein
MWKLLRNSILLAVLVAGVLKLVLWYEIQQGAARLAAQLAPIGQMQYGSVSAALNGEVQFGTVSLTVGKSKLRETWRASLVDLETPGALWLARRLLLRDDSLPEHLVISIKGLQAPASALPELSWLSPISLVPFETLGCGVVSRFSVADYQRMGLNPGAQQQRIDYRYDAAAASLSFNADFLAPPFSTIVLHGELQKFDPRALATNWQKLHVGELAVGYTDGGYFTKRNRFCAQQAGISAGQYIDQHMAAVDAFLAERGVQPSTEIDAVYRSLVTDGGRVSALSLPAAASSLGQLLSESPDVMTRQLNLTARRNDGPPVMLRLAFKPANTQDAAAAANAPAQPPVATTAVASQPTNPVPVTATPQAAAVKPGPAAPSASLPAPAKKPSLPAIAARPPPPAAAARPALAPDLLSPAPGAAPTKSAAAAKPPATSADTPALLPSTPQPAPDSTLALVWKPTFDRLDATPSPPPPNYDVIDYSALMNGYVGRFVRLLTTTGKKVEGSVVSVDATTLALHIKRPGGSAELQVPRSLIVEIRVPHTKPSGDNR